MNVIASAVIDVGEVRLVLYQSGWVLGVGRVAIYIGGQSASTFKQKGILANAAF